MDATVLILIILTVIYVPIWVIVWRSPKAKERGFEKYGPIIKINTHFGLKFIDRFGRYTRFWRAFGVFSQIVSFVLMLMMLFMMVVAVINLPSSLGNGGVGVEYVFAIPGLNPILPFWYGLLALIIALVCHEMAHGLQSRANGVGVKHTGLLYGIVPLGAFVEPDEKDVEKVSRRSRLDIYTAGITTNFVLAAVAFLIFSGAMLGSISSPYGDSPAVYNEVSDSPAYDAGLEAGAVIVSINGSQFTYTSDYYVGSVPYSWYPGDEVTVTYLTDGGGSQTAVFRWGVYVSKTVDGSPASGILEDSIITSFVFGGEIYYFYTAQGFSEFMQLTDGGDTVTVNYLKKDPSGSYAAGSRDIILDSNGSIGYFGMYASTSGMTLITPDILLRTASDPFYGADGLFDYARSSLSYMTHPFTGFDPVPQSVEWWYGDQFAGFWEICRALYWIFWLNLMLGITNALPALPFDGGLVFQGWVDKLYERRGVADKEERAAKANEITRNVSTLMLFLYFLVIIAALV